MHKKVVKRGCLAPHNHMKGGNKGVKKGTTAGSSRAIRPALTPDAREEQLISLAVDLVEKRLIEGTASSQETTHFLKLASSKARLEKAILEKQKELIEAKTQSLQSEARMEELVSNALTAFKSYAGHDESYEP